MSKTDQSLIKTPMTDLPGNPNERKPGGGDWNGEPGYPKRTGGADGPPERSRDSNKG